MLILKMHSKFSKAFFVFLAASFLTLPNLSFAQDSNEFLGQAQQVDEDGKPKKTKIIYEKKKGKKGKKRAQEQANMYLPDDGDMASGVVINDSIEPVNRAIFKFNSVFDRYLLHPVASSYRSVVPDKGREMVGNFLQNLGSPITFANSILQGDIENTLVTFWRFAINTTVGVGGLFDPAEDMGLLYKKEDFGLTLASYGVGHGTYIVLPILGPSSVRDGVGLIVDIFADPTTYANDWIRYGVNGTRIVHGRSEVLPLTDTIDKVSLDPYASYKSGYAQRRQDMINANKESDSFKPVSAE